MTGDFWPPSFSFANIALEAEHVASALPMRLKLLHRSEVIASQFTTSNFTFKLSATSLPVLFARLVFEALAAFFTSEV